MTMADTVDLVAPVGLTDVRGAAEWLHVSRSKVFALLKDGQIGSLMVGGSRRIPYAELQAFVEREMGAS